MKHVLVVRPRSRIQVIAAGARGAAGAGGAAVDALREMIEALTARVAALEAGAPSVPANALTDGAGNYLVGPSGQILTVGVTV